MTDWHYTFVIFPLDCFLDMLSEIAFISLMLSSAETSILYSVDEVEEALEEVLDTIDTGTGISDCAAAWMAGPGGVLILGGMAIPSTSGAGL